MMQSKKAAVAVEVVVVVVAEEMIDVEEEIEGMIDDVVAKEIKENPTNVKTTAKTKTGRSEIKMAIRKRRKNTAKTQDQKMKAVDEEGKEMMIVEGEVKRNRIVKEETLLMLHLRGRSAGGLTIV